MCCPLCAVCVASSPACMPLGRLKAATQEAEQARRERVAWERQVGEMQGRCSTLEEEKYEAYDKVRDSIQLAEEASLQKEQVSKGMMK